MKLGKRILAAFLTVLMISGATMPSYAYSASGTEGVANGEMSMAEGVFVNLSEFGKEWLQGEIEGMIKPSLLPEPFSAVVDTLILTAGPFYDLGCAISGWGRAKRELAQACAMQFEVEYIGYAQQIEDYYRLGITHRGTSSEKPDLSQKNKERLASFRNAAESIKEAKNDLIFIGSKKEREKLQGFVDALYELCNSFISFDYYYNLGRYGSEYCTVLADVKINTECRIVSKSTGKYFNIYTDRSVDNLKNGDRIKVYKYCNDGTQEFCFVKNEQGAYRIRVNDAKKYVDIYNTSTTKIAKSGAKVQIWSKGSSNYFDQGFVFVYVDGYYRIHLAADTNYCLYVKSDGYVALGKAKENSSAQLWKIKYN